MSLPAVAIVGRPNVGKSSLFNALLGERLSIVHDSPGVTRDRIFRETEWYNTRFRLIDTGGLSLGREDPFLEEIARQVGLAIAEADVVIFLCDARAGLTGGDREIAELLRRSGIPVLLTLNKVDQVGTFPDNGWDFYELGLGEIYCISSLHKLGLGELISAAIAAFPERQETAEEAERIPVAIIGKPNVGKSSLLNRLLSEERAIVSAIPGTTRDALDVDLNNSHGRYRLIDTAGLRRKSRIDSAVEKYSVLRTEQAIERADVCLILLDASEEISEQDLKVAGKAHEAGKASVFVLNKWDLLQAGPQTFDEKKRQLAERFAFMDYAPVISISALSGQRVDGIFDLINQVAAMAVKRVSTALVNEVLADALAMHPTPSDKGKHLKIYYASQVANKPPQFVFFINDQDLLHFSYERYMENRFREAFGFQGNPLRFFWRERKSGDYIRVREDGDRQG